jgi:site-specific recombinase XerD
MPLEAWPVEDRDAYEAAIRPGDPLEPGGLGAEWSSYSRRKNVNGYGRWLTWLSIRGLLDSSIGPPDRTTRERIAAYVKDLHQLNAPLTVLTRVEELIQMLRVMVPGYNIDWLRRVAGRIRMTAVSSRNKRQRVKPSEYLVDFGLELMAKAEGADGGTPLMRAVTFRDGLMLALLAARPFRRKNFAAIEIGRHLVGVGDTYWLRFAASETKSRRPIDVPFPAGLQPCLERYLSHYRPLLARRTGRWNRECATAALWLSTHGSAMTEIAIYFRIMKLTEKKFGHIVNPHLFRDSAATSIAIEDPEHVRCTMAVLGHGSLTTSEKHYNQAGSLEASRRLQNHVLQLRRKFKELAGKCRTTCGCGRDTERSGDPS